MSALTKVVAIARVNLVRTLRDKTGFFFIFVLPFIIIAALGIQFGSATTARLGLVASPDDPLAGELVVALESGDLPFEVRRTTDEAAVRSAVERGSLEAGLVLPDDYAEALRGDATVEVVFLGTPESTTAGLRPAIEAALGIQAVLVTGARAGETFGDVPFADALDIAREGVTAVPGVTLVVEQVGGEPWYAGFGQFTLAAHTQLVLFVFMTSMTAAAQLVMSKQLGVSRRMLATATSPGTVIAGETLGRFGVAMLQAEIAVPVRGLSGLRPRSGRIHSRDLPQDASNIFARHAGVKRLLQVLTAPADGEDPEVLRHISQRSFECLHLWKACHKGFSRFVVEMHVSPHDQLLDLDRLQTLRPGQVVGEVLVHPPTDVLATTMVRLIPARRVAVVQEQVVSHHVVLIRTPCTPRVLVARPRVQMQREKADF